VLRSVFMGSPEFAVAGLEVVRERTDLQAVYTQPDKPRGRGNKVVPTPVKARALEMGLPVHEPKRIRDEEVVAQLRAYAPDVILVVAYAKLIPPVILEMPRFGCINVHPSLLPRYRGAIPLLAAVMNGDPTTGVCTFFMDEGYDTGDLILKRETPLGPDETGEELSKRLSLVGADLLRETIAQLEAGSFARVKQSAEAEGGYTKPLKKEDFFIDWNWPAERIRNFVRALAHDPGASTVLNGNPMKLGRVSAVEGSGAPGTVLGSVRGKGLEVACGDGALRIEQVKPPGKGWMDAWSWLQGAAVQPGQLFTGPA